MSIDKLIQKAVVLAMLAAATGQLPRITRAVQIAQLHLLKESQSSHWGRALLLPISRDTLPCPAEMQSSPNTQHMQQTKKVLRRSQSQAA